MIYNVIKLLITQSVCIPGLVVMLLRQCQVWTRGPGHCLVWVSVSAQPLCVNDNSGSDQALTQTPHIWRDNISKNIQYTQQS